MARVARLGGAILVQADEGGGYFLVGNTKRPCDWAREGFAVPPEIDALARPFTALAPLTRGAPVTLTPPVLVLRADGAAAAELLARRFLIERNGAVSDRLWRLVIQPEGDDGPPPAALVDAAWLEAMPAPIWQIVRDTVLRCV
ncbi:MAG TPA: precorrin-3B C(17)-methyltransferase [Polyangia bacterium]|nr:precorrin-3B C(17)-methyltransferase [Polyangia bacterium]